MDILIRLAWALPLVLAVGLAAMLVLRRFVVPAAGGSGPTRRMSVRESLALSDETRAHLVEIDGKPYLIVESLRRTALEPLQVGVAEPRRSAGVSHARWLRMFTGRTAR
jgi:flagellar biogenesis protein FliO